MSEIWERLPEESSKAYEAFCIYRDLGTERSLVKVAQKRNKTSSKSRLNFWSVKYNWVERARAYDDYIEQERRKAREQAILEMGERHASEAIGLQQIALKRLKQLNPEDLTVKDVLNFLIEAMKIERISRGEPGTIVKQSLNPVILEVVKTYEDTPAPGTDESLR